MINKILLLLTILSLQFQFANQESFVKVDGYNQIIIKEIINNNYKVVNDLLSKRLINSRSVVDGKPLLIHAVINDRPDMVNLLIRFGAQPYADYCDEGFNAHEWAVKSESYYARAELIVCLLYTSPSPRDLSTSRMPSSA